MGSPYLYQVLQFTPTYQFKLEVFQWPETVQWQSSQKLVIQKQRAKTNLSCLTDVKPWSFSIILFSFFFLFFGGILRHLVSVFTTWGAFSVKTVRMFTSVFALTQFVSLHKDNKALPLERAHLNADIPNRLSLCFTQMGSFERRCSAAIKSMAVD